jgi:hypothetical protein
MDNTKPAKAARKKPTPREIDGTAWTDYFYREDIIEEMLQGDQINLHGFDTIDHTYLIQEGRLLVIIKTKKEHSLYPPPLVSDAIMEEPPWDPMMDVIFTRGSEVYPKLIICDEPYHQPFLVQIDLMGLDAINSDFELGGFAFNDEPEDDEIAYGMAQEENLVVVVNYEQYFLKEE